MLEAGLGARHDATSAAEPEAVVLTNVGLDHTEYLGETVEEISGEKLASLSAGSVLILGTDDPRVVVTARERCAEVGARLVEAATETGADSRGSTSIRRAQRPAGAAGGGGAAGTGARRAERLAVRAIVGTLPGRFEVHQVGGVPVVVDGGHNPSGVEAALEALRSAYGERPLGVVFGVLRDKDAGSMLTGLRKEARVLVLTRPEGERAADPAQVMREHGPRDRRREAGSGGARRREGRRGGGR